MRPGRRFVRLFAAMLASLCALAAPAAAMAGTAPVVVGTISNTTSLSSAVSVAVSGNVAYTTAALPGQLTAVDISNPASPTILGSTPPTTTLENGSNVTIAGHYAFVVAKNRNASPTSNDDGSGNALTIVDISNPSAPAVVGSVQSGTQLFGSYGVAVSGNYAYVAYQGVLPGQPTAPDPSLGGFTVIDITNPAGPTIVANIDNPSSGTFQNAFKHSTSVQISGHYAFVTAFYDQRITVVDISTPTSPHIVASLRDATNLGAPADLAIQGTDLYVANQTSGTTAPEFTVISIANPLAPTVLATVSNSMLAGAYRIRVRGDFAYVSGFSASAVSAIDISDPTHPRFAGAVQDAIHLHRTSGLDLDASGRYVIANSPNQSTDSTPLYPPFPATHGSISVVDMAPNPIAVTITPASEPPNPTTQTSASFSFSTNDDVSAVACSLDGAAPGPCTSPTSQTYSGLLPGNHTFTVQATDSSGHTANDSYSWGVLGAPVSISPPTVHGYTGAPQPGDTLSASTGTWAALPTPTFTYQWQRCSAAGAGCADLSGAANPTYSVGPSDVGTTLRVVVTATNPYGSPQGTSTATSVVGLPSNTSAPSVSGTAAENQTLTASPGTWQGSPAPTLTYQWQRCNAAGAGCADLSGATQPSYTATHADVGSRLAVVVTGSNAQGASKATSIPTPVIVGPPQNTASPTVTGSPTQGQTLTVSPGTWTGAPAPTFTYAWQRCGQGGTGCSPIAGATGQTYTANRADVGGTLKVAVTGSNASGSATASAGPTVIVTGPPQNSAAPNISGRPLIGSQLTATSGTWTGYPAPSLSRQWQRCRASGANCRAIGGATGASYTVSAADLGSSLRVVVTANNSAGSSAANSARTGTVAASAKATLRGLKSRHVSIKLSASTPRAGSALKKLTLSLPKGLSFKRLGSGIHVTSASGHKLRFTAKLVHGVLTITLRSPASSVTISVDAASISETVQLAKAVKAKHIKHVTLTVGLSGTHGLSARDPVSATVAS